MLDREVTVGVYRSPVGDRAVEPTGVTGVLTPGRKTVREPQSIC
jgi:hypothetical protein